MNSSELDFEKPFIALERHLVELDAFTEAHPELDLTEGISALKKNANTLAKRTFQKLNRWDKVRLARHPQRPQASLYINALLEEPLELRSDKLYGDDRALIGGFAWFEEQPIVYLAQQKGTNLEERREMNFGYTHPEGYRKARRLMQLANKYKRPLICFVDTPGAHFDLRSEEYGQAAAIADNLAEMMQMHVPILVVIIGEGGSGGALAIAVGNRVLMMEYAVYCVAPPEACSGIVWKDKGEHAPEATEGYKPTAPDLLKLNIIDQVIGEPIGGAHRDPAAAVRNVKRAMKKHLTELLQMSEKQLVQQRYERYRNLGLYGEDEG